jgi:2-isopropylmalate synthase
MSAFAHKGGIHVSAVERNPRTYEHITPESVGNERRILVSELSGRSNLRARLRPLLGDIDDAAIAKILTRLVELESQGWTFEAADASFELLARRSLGQLHSAFRLLNHRIHGIALEGLPHAVEASVKLVDRQGVTRHTIAEGDGPFDALWHALIEALLPSLPALARLKLVDFKVRVINTQDGTAAKVRVLIDHRFDDKPICTVGVDENILEASWKALVDAVEYAVKDESKS